MPIVIIPIIVLLTNELLKVVIQSLKAGKLELKWFMHAGGMPSGHSAFTSSIATISGLIAGFESVEFMLALGFAVIVIYDARGLRATVGKHAKVINKYHKAKQLDESVGHTNLEAFTGAVLGIAMSLIIYDYAGIIPFSLWF